jgi:hypothetical protein
MPRESSPPGIHGPSENAESHEVLSVFQGKFVSSDSFDRFLFPERKWITFALVVVMSIGISFLLIGKQVFLANWGIIDDGEIFLFLGRHTRLPLLEFFNVLLNMTEVGHFGSGRFRPSYYVLILLESSAWGTNVHLWYLTRTLCFGVFIASLWWILSRFLQIWLGAALLFPILVLPFWSDVWTRLGPSEVYGTLALGLLLLGIYGSVASETACARTASSTVMTVAAFILIGSKETFVPLAGAAVVVFLFCGLTRRLPIWIAALSILAISAYAALVLVAMKQSVLDSGNDFYANKIDVWHLLRVGWDALHAALSNRSISTGYAVIILGSGVVSLLIRRSRDWIFSTGVLLAIFCFMAAVYFTQYVFYRGDLPTQMRYDFPASLFVPFSYLALTCYVFYGLRLVVSARVTNYISAFLALGVLIAYLPIITRVDPSPLTKAVNLNIEKTSEFFHAVQAIAAAAQQSPGADIILEAYGPGAYEPVFLVFSYMRALGVDNSVAVRLHPAPMSFGPLYDRLEKHIRDWQDNGTESYIPLSKARTSGPQNCISVGINGMPDAACATFEVKT